MELDAASEAMAVRLNRTFAAANSMRSMRPEGYEGACRQLAALKEKLEGEPIRMKILEERARELSGGTFHWDP